MKKILTAFLSLWLVAAGYSQVVSGHAAIAGSIAAGGGGGGSGTVTSVAETFTGGIISVAGSPITTSGTFALTLAGTSGGIPYFSDATHWATSALLTSGAVMAGGGAGVAPSTPSATTTLDASGNFSTPGSLRTGAGGSAAGTLELTQGTAATVGTTSVKISAPASVTSYLRLLEGSAGSTGVYVGTVSGTTVTDSKVAPGSSGNVLTSNGTIWTSAAAAGGGDTIISPTGLSADTNDWNPTSLSTATVIRVTATAGPFGLSGIVAPAGGAQRLRLENISANTIILRDKLCGLSSAANAFSFSGVDIPLYPGTAIDLIYDATSTLWRGLQTATVPTLRQGVYITNEFQAVLGTTGIINMVSTANGTGSGAGFQTPSVTEYVPTFYGETGTTGASAVYGGIQGNNGNNWMLANTSYWRLSFRLRTTTASDSTNRFFIRAGFNDGATGKDDAVDGVYLRYTDNVNSGNWVLVLRNNSTETAVNLSAGPTFSSSTVNDYSIVILPSRVEVWQNGASIGSTTTLTNAPLTRATELMFAIAKDGVSAGTSTRQLDINGIEVVMYRATP